MEEIMGFLNDLKFAARGLLRTPSFTAIAVATLALGIGSNTAVFTVVRSVLISPLPYAEPDRIVKIGARTAGVGVGELVGSPAELWDFQERSTSFESITGVWALHTNLVGGDQPVRLSTALVHTNFFDVLGVQPAMGRGLVNSDMHLGVGTNAVLSWSAWQQYFGGAEDIIGHTINIDGDPLEVVGVMPRGFHHPGKPLGGEIEMWGAMDLNPGGRWFFRNFRPMQLFGRLNDGVSVEAAGTDLARVAQGLRAEFPNSYPEGGGWTTGIELLKTEVVGSMELVLLILFGAVGFVLLVACTNVAALLMTRGAARARQTAVRLALGCSRGAIIRFQLAESLILSLIGGVISVLVAVTTTGFLRTRAMEFIPRAELIEFELPVLVFALLVAAVSGLLFGMAPAISASRSDPLSLINEGARGSSKSSGIFRDTLVIGEVAASVVLVVGAGLLIKSFNGLMSVDVGFEPTNVKVVQTYLPVQIDPNEGIYRAPDNRINFYSEVIRRLEEMPQVTLAAGVSKLPLREVLGVNFGIEGDDDVGARPSAEYRVISPKYFDVMTIPLIRGEIFDGLENPDTPLRVMVNQAWVGQFAVGRDPIGMRVQMGGGTGGAWREIVGVVGDVKQQSLDSSTRPTIYASYLQSPGHDMTFVFQSAAAAGPILESAREIVRTVDPDQPAFSMATMDDVVAESVAERSVLMWMVSLFGVQALVLAGLGVFGVVSFRVKQRNREIGIRIALGAKPGSVLSLVLRDGFKLVGIGVAVGMIGAVWSSTVLESMLFGVGRFDPVVLVGVAVVTLGVALIGALIPAQRATSVDPLETLKAE